MLVFAGIGLVGFFFLIVAALFGGSHDAGDMDHDHDFGHDAGPSPFSLRVISLFLTGFGATGAIARSYEVNYPLSSLAGVAAGAAVGFAGFKLIGFFMQQQASSTVQEEDLIGHQGQVSIAIPPGGVGQVELTVKGQRRFVTARAATDVAIEEGAQIKVTRSAGSQVVVEKA
jgi:membrane protein implicated in regulation of membrane protease activity